MNRRSFSPESTPRRFAVPENALRSGSVPLYSRGCYTLLELERAVVKSFCRFTAATLCSAVRRGSPPSYLGMPFSIPSPIADGSAQRDERSHERIGGRRFVLRDRRTTRVNKR